MIEDRTAKMTSGSAPTAAFIDGQCMEAVDSFIYLG